jgi:desulfoferrodoxin (superoxide reductase-like protein)
MPENALKTTFNIEAKDITARAYCDIHGLWKKSKL